MQIRMRFAAVLLLAAVSNPSGITGELARLLNLPLELTTLDAAVVFAPPTGMVEVDLREWVTFARPRDLDQGDGLVFVGSPLEEEALCIEKAVDEAITHGARTADLGGKLSTRQMADEIIKRT